MMNILEMIIPEGIYTVFGSGLNKRLGTEDLTVAELEVEAAKRGTSFEELYKMHETDGWIYHGAGPLDGFNYVCSAYVIGHYIAAGVF